jgi:hypothetical protein
MNTNAGAAGTTTAVDAPPVLVPLAHAHAPGPVPVLVLVRSPDHGPLRDTRAHARVPIHTTGCVLAPAPAHVHGKEKGTMNTLVRVARPADATGMHVSVSVPVFLPVLVVLVVIISTMVVCPVLEGDVVVLRLSDTRHVNFRLILRVNGQDENVNTMCIASGRRLLVARSAAAAAVAVAVAVLCLDNLSLSTSGRVFC